MTIEESVAGNAQHEADHYDITNRMMERVVKAQQRAMDEAAARVFQYPLTYRVQQFGVDLDWLPVID